MLLNILCLLCEPYLPRFILQSSTSEYPKVFTIEMSNFDEARRSPTGRVFSKPLLSISKGDPVVGGGGRMKILHLKYCQHVQLWDWIGVGSGGSHLSCLCSEEIGGCFRRLILDKKAEYKSVLGLVRIINSKLQIEPKYQRKLEIVKELNRLSLKRLRVHGREVRRHVRLNVAKSRATQLTTQMQGISRRDRKRS
jgi:hypothetical protein